ncbi:MAG: UDP-glucose 4-epimerase GalE [Actinomycetia bacterium]|nr:UDP-glucose 4-epimerase GalE [Actinomycetes bacterium]
MRVLVTGGAGYVGLAVSAALLEAGHAVVRYDDLSQTGDPGPDLGVFVRGDVRDVEALHDVLRRHRVEAVVHCAGKIAVGESVVRPGWYWAHNVGGTLALLGAMRRAGVVPLVFSSSAAVYGEPETIPIPEDHPARPLSPYGRTKLAAEWALADAAHAGELAYVALRYFNAAGAVPGVPGERHRPEGHLIPNAIRAALGGPPLRVFGTDYPTPDGTAVRDYVHVADLAAAHVLALEHLARGGASGPFNLANRTGYSVREVVRAVERASGRPVPWEAAPRRPGDPALLVGESARARAVLGWRPRYEALDAIVETAVAWHRTEEGI